MSQGFTKTAAFVALIAVVPMQSAFAGCQPEQYFSASDFDHIAPLGKPASEFADDLRRAKAGDHLAQRSIAISYETGYLVSKCDEQALYWYGKAAKGGDKEAVGWMAERDATEHLATGPDCIGENCRAATAPGAQRMTLAARGSHGHFFTTLTINGVSVEAMIDTGASTVALPALTATRMGISPEGFTPVRMSTANGIAMAYVKTVPQLRLGSFDLNNVEVTVSQGNTMVLVGMSALRQLKVDVDKGYMTLSK